jgi:hypothetical protein
MSAALILPSSIRLADRTLALLRRKHGFESRIDLHKISCSRSETGHNVSLLRRRSGFESLRERQFNGVVRRMVRHLTANEATH